MNGGSGTPRADDANIAPGDMVSVVLVSGDDSIAASCTVTAITADRIYACGHPITGFGNVQYPLARGRAAESSSDMDSTKIVTTGGTIGPLSRSAHRSDGHARRGTKDDFHGHDARHAQQRERIPFSTGATIRKLYASAGGHRRLETGSTSNTAYSDGTTRLSGEIAFVGHSPVQIENMFAPVDAPVPDG